MRGALALGVLLAALGMPPPATASPPAVDEPVTGAAPSDAGPVTGDKVAVPVSPESSPGIFLPPPPSPFPSHLLDRLTGPLEIEAGRLELRRQEGLVLATGGVELRQGERTILAQSARVDLPANRVQLEGPVHLIAPEGVFTGERAELALDALTGVVYRGTLVSAGGGLRLSAARLERDAQGRYLLVDGEFTVCDCPAAAAPPGGEVSALRAFLARPSWSVEAKQARFSPGERRSGRIRFQDAVLRVKGLPVFYLPWGELPVGDARVSGLLAPELRRSDDGLLFRLPFYLVTGPASDLTLGLGWYGARGFKPDLELRYLTGSSGGQLNVSWIYDRTRSEAAAGTAESGEVSTSEGASPHRGALHWRHRSRRGPSLELLADINEVSDPTWLQDFGGELEVRSRELLASQARVQWQTPRLLASIGLERYTALGADAVAALGQMPALRLAGRGPVWRGVPGLLELRGTAGAFYQTGWPAGLEAGTWYASIEPALVWGRALGRFLMAGASLGYAGQLELEADGSAGGEVNSRQRVRGQLELSTALARTFERRGRGPERLYHRLEPGLALEYDLWQREEAGFTAPVGEPVGTVRQVTGRLTQRLYGRWAGEEGGRTVDLGAFTAGATYGLEAGGTFSGLEGELELRFPIELRLASRLELPSGRLGWLKGAGRYSGEAGWLELGYGWIGASSVTGLEAMGMEEGAVSELQASTGLNLRTALGGVGVKSRWLKGWSLEGRFRISPGETFEALSRRLALRYESPCRCFSAQLFVALDRDQEVPDLRLWLAPSAGVLEGIGGVAW